MIISYVDDKGSHMQNWKMGVMNEGISEHKPETLFFHHGEGTVFCSFIVGCIYCVQDVLNDVRNRHLGVKCGICRKQKHP